MFVKMKIGRDAGRIVEMKYIDAKVLIDSGRAILAYPPDPVAQPPMSQQPPAESRKKKKSK